MELAAIVPLPATVHAAAFAPVAGEVALVRVVRALLGPVPTSGIIVVADESLVAEARSCLDSAGLSAVSVITSWAPGTRRQCLAAAVEHLGREAHPASHVLVHDHRHPLAPVDVTERVIAGLRAGHPVVAPVLPMTDTVKVVDDRGAVVGTVDRTALRTVQYPRGYQSAVLAQSITGDADEFVAALAAGTPIATVDGDADAFAAELPTDAPLLDAISATHHPG
ncbi:2-C-methyl-D-erythritol 4-phosphate cytidylyltransferase [Mycobacterium sp. AZCC_0083]|uniref:IspD/TarI family cytidylyltransferase n=1 Tax=Mycobacterium sp. AZCC_0083 TaxID=2735882 RepID=UPI00160B4D7B|nr:2-C-methyl-D-erythritol 4-phosphate cytidylyltransferase [Mycobacterium sp. AZCC_0083]MBB5165420.1 2-C-methyl-D-erythritol 4-phosphate cytidylyltransferase [Mycobacterium sp. AZCC_0083]